MLTPTNPNPNWQQDLADGKITYTRGLKRDISYFVSMSLCKGDEEKARNLRTLLAYEERFIAPLFLRHV
jgi:hypothetical protein